MNASGGWGFVFWLNMETFWGKVVYDLGLEGLEHFIGKNK